jgi:hypothetical protein
LEDYFSFLAALPFVAPSVSRLALISLRIAVCRSISASMNFSFILSWLTSARFARAAFFSSSVPVSSGVLTASDMVFSSRLPSASRYRSVREMATAYTVSTTRHFFAAPFATRAYRSRGLSGVAARPRNPSPVWPGVGAQLGLRPVRPGWKRSSPDPWIDGRGAPRGEAAEIQQGDRGGGGDRGVHGHTRDLALNKPLSAAAPLQNAHDLLYLLRLLDLPLNRRPPLQSQAGRLRRGEM